MSSLACPPMSALPGLSKVDRYLTSYIIIDILNNLFSGGPGPEDL